MLAEIGVRVIETVHPDDLKPAPFNPKSRTTTGSVAKLKREIEKAGKIIVPLIVTLDGFVADGHRRLTVARELGLSSVPILREDMTLADLWANLNGGNQSISKKNWMQAVREGMPLECAPEKERKVLADLIRVMGRKMFEKMTDEGKGPSIIIVAQYVARYCGKDNDKFTREIVLWFMAHGTLRDAKTAVSTGCPPDVIEAAIKEGRSIRQSWVLSD